MKSNRSFQTFAGTVLRSLLFLSGAGAALISCTQGAPENRLVIWHQMRPDERQILEKQLDRYMRENPGMEVVELYKETEELRNGFVIASIAGQGPDLVYGPSDPVGIYEATRTIQPLDTLFSEEYLAAFDSAGLLNYKGHLYMVADKIGNHLALAYNKKFIPVRIVAGDGDSLVRPVWFIIVIDYWDFGNHFPILIQQCAVNVAWVIHPVRHMPEVFPYNKIGIIS